MITYDALVTALRLFEGGRIPEAEEICRSVLSHSSRDGRAWHLLGVIAHRLGRGDGR